TSVTIKISPDFYEHVKKYGWPTIKTEGAHWLNKSTGKMKECGQCKKVVKVEELKKYWYRNSYYKKKYGITYGLLFDYLCKDCHDREYERMEESMKETVEYLKIKEKTTSSNN